MRIFGRFFFYTSTRNEVAKINDIYNGTGNCIQVSVGSWRSERLEEFCKHTDLTELEELEVKLFCIGMDINPQSNLQAFHMTAAMDAIYSPQLAN